MSADTAHRTGSAAETVGGRPPYLRSASDVAADENTDPGQGLSAAEAAGRLASHGPNQIAGDPPPSLFAVAVQQLRDPMNLMLVAVTAISLAIGQVSTGILVGLLVVLNVVLGARQELKARASVDALSKLQVPQCRVLRGGAIVLVPAV